MWWPDCSKCCKILTRQIPHCLTTKACVCCILRCRFAEVSFVVFSFMLDSRNRAGQVGAAHLCSGPAVGHVSRAVCQTGHRLPLHLSCFHGNATFDLCILFYFFREFSEVALKGFFYFIYYSNLVYSCFCLLQLLEGNFALFITYALGHRKDFQNILLVIMVSVCIFTMSALLVKTLIRVDLVYINTMSADVKLAACCKLFWGYFSF